MGDITMSQVEDSCHYQETGRAVPRGREDARATFVGRCSFAHFFVVPTSKLCCLFPFREKHKISPRFDNF